MYNYVIIIYAVLHNSFFLAAQINKKLLTGAVFAFPDYESSLLHIYYSLAYVVQNLSLHVALQSFSDY